MNLTFEFRVWLDFNFQGGPTPLPFILVLYKDKTSKERAYTCLTITLVIFFVPQSVRCGFARHGLPGSARAKIAGGYRCDGDRALHDSHCVGCNIVYVI